MLLDSVFKFSGNFINKLIFLIFVVNFIFSIKKKKDNKNTKWNKNKI